MTPAEELQVADEFLNRTRRKPWISTYPEGRIPVARKKQYIRSLKERTPCADCGGHYPYWVMDFDHLRDKVFEISDMVFGTCNLRRLQAEIAKCEVVCANCHRERTHHRAIDKGTET